MNWNEMSVFHKVVQIIQGVSILALCVVLFCFIGGVIPSMFRPPLVTTLFGTNCLARSILNWKKQRVMAVIDLVTVLLCFAALCWWIAVKLIVH